VCVCNIFDHVCLTRKCSEYRSGSTSTSEDYGYLHAPTTAAGGSHIANDCKERVKRRRTSLCRHIAYYSIDVTIWVSIIIIIIIICTRPSRIRLLGRDVIIWFTGSPRVNADE